MNCGVPQMQQPQSSNLPSPQSSMPSPQSTLPRKTPRRNPGRPRLHTFDKPEDQLTPDERKRKTAITKRRDRQNRAYRRNKRNKRSNYPALPQVVPDAACLSPQPVRSPMHPVVPTPVNNPWPQDTPLVIPGFSQNPLDLLASASGTEPNSSVSAATRSHSFSAPDATIDTSPGSKSEPAFSLNEPDRVSVHPVMNHRNAPSSIPQPSPDPMSYTSENPVTVELDATTAPSLDTAMLAFPLDEQKDEDERSGTDDLVKSALVAAEAYAKGPFSLKDAMDSESELLHRTSFKTIMFDNLRLKYMSMDPSVQNALRHFVIFPRTFNLQAAASVAGLQQSQLVVVQGMLESMIQNNFIEDLNGRYELNEPARRFLDEDDTVFNHNLASNAYDVAQKRFVKHYERQLRSLQDEDIHKIGWLREQAMALYDSERENMVFSEYLLSGKGKKDELREFLSAGITVMRYCVSAADREKVLREALKEDETSTEDILIGSFDLSNIVEETTSSAETDKQTEECDNAHRARLQLALSEACFDQLKTEEAVQPLTNALKLMKNPLQRCEKSNHSGVVDLVVVLLLLSNLRLGANRIKEALTLCIEALRVLKGATLGRSTFGINAMSNLVTIYLRERQLNKAKSVASRLLDILNTMRYTGMPIYADALGVCAMVSMAEGNYAEAEKQYVTALETVGKWGSKDWTGIPVQHCLDLDIWLMEGLADAVRRQGRVEKARELEQTAAEVRVTRGLSRNLGISEDTDDSGRPATGLESRQTLRHLY